MQSLPRVARSGNALSQFVVGRMLGRTRQLSREHDAAVIVAQPLPFPAPSNRGSAAGRKLAWLWSGDVESNLRFQQIRCAWLDQPRNAQSAGLLKPPTPLLRSFGCCEFDGSHIL